MTVPPNADVRHPYWVAPGSIDRLGTTRAFTAPPPGALEPPYASRPKHCRCRKFGTRPTKRHMDRCVAATIPARCIAIIHSRSGLGATLGATPNPIVLNLAGFGRLLCLVRWVPGHHAHRRRETTKRLWAKGPRKWGIRGIGGHPETRRRATSGQFGHSSLAAVFATKPRDANCRRSRAGSRAAGAGRPSRRGASRFA